MEGEEMQGGMTEYLMVGDSCSELAKSLFSWRSGINYLSGLMGVGAQGWFPKRGAVLYKRFLTPTPPLSYRPTKSPWAKAIRGLHGKANQ